MLINRISKTVYPYEKNSTFHMNFPKEAYEKLGGNYIMEIHDDKIVMYPVRDLPKE